MVGNRRDHAESNFIRETTGSWAFEQDRAFAAWLTPYLHFAVFAIPTGVFPNAQWIEHVVLFLVAHLSRLAK